MEDLHRLLEEHDFLKDLPADETRLLVSCAKNLRFRPGDFLMREGQPADQFYLLRTGRVALEIAVPARGPVQMESLGPGDMLGFDGACLRGKMDTFPLLGYALTRRVLGETYKRLERVRLARVDMYGGS
jgi:CRP-like cAMP-binding protein